MEKRVGCKIETRHENQHSGRPERERGSDASRVSSGINWSAAARYMTSNNYRKWNLVGGRGGPAEQLVDSDAVTVHAYRRPRPRPGAARTIDETPNLQSGPPATEIRAPRRSGKNNESRCGTTRRRARILLSLSFNEKSAP